MFMYRLKKTCPDQSIASGTKLSPRMILLTVIIIFLSICVYAQKDVEKLPPELKEIPAFEEPTQEKEVAKKEKEKKPKEMEIIFKVHEVKRGDCFWKISRRYYGVNDRWREIHKFNQYVKDPHWIFPDNEIIVPTYKEIIKVPKKGKIKKKEIEKDTFIASPDEKFDGCITALKEEKMMPAYGDCVFVDIGEFTGVKPKSRYTIYRVEREIYHPDTDELIGTLIKKVGVLEITDDIGEHDSTAFIVMSREPVLVGDLIKLKPE